MTAHGSSGFYKRPQVFAVLWIASVLTAWFIGGFESDRSRRRSDLGRPSQVRDGSLPSAEESKERLAPADAVQAHRSSSGAKNPLEGHGDAMDALPPLAPDRKSRLGEWLHSTRTELERILADPQDTDAVALRLLAELDPRSNPSIHLMLELEGVKPVGVATILSRLMDDRLGTRMLLAYLRELHRNSGGAARYGTAVPAWLFETYGAWMTGYLDAAGQVELDLLVGHLVTNRQTDPSIRDLLAKIDLQGTILGRIRSRPKAQSRLAVERIRTAGFDSQSFAEYIDHVRFEDSSVLSLEVLFSASIRAGSWAAISHLNRLWRADADVSALDSAFLEALANGKYGTGGGAVWRYLAATRRGTWRQAEPLISRGLQSGDRAAKYIANGLMVLRVGIPEEFLKNAAASPRISGDARGTIAGILKRQSGGKE